MVDWTQPTITTAYTQVLTDLDDRLDECAIMFDGTTSTNIPTGALRIDTSDLYKLERYGGATWDAMNLTITGTLTAEGLLTTAASIAGTAGFNIPEGVAPTVPNDGDMWVTTTDAFVRVNGVSESILASGASASPGGSDEQLQWNDNGVFGGITSFTYNGTNTLSVGISMEFANNTQLRFSDALLTRLYSDGSDFTILTQEDILIRDLGSASALRITITPAGVMSLHGGALNVETGDLFVGTGAAEAGLILNSPSNGDPILTWQQNSVAKATMQFRDSGEALRITNISSILEFYSANTLAVTIGTSQEASFTGQINAAAGTTAIASLNIPEGVAKTTPVDGDIWVTTTDIFARINGVSESLLGGGIAASADKWTTARTFDIIGDIVGTGQSFDGSADLTFTAALQSNSCDSAQYVDNSIDQIHVNANAVGQSEIKAVAQALTQQFLQFTATGGVYTLGFKMQERSGNDREFIPRRVGNTDSSSEFSEWVFSAPNTSNNNGTIQYINSSPPYDLGDGEIPLFIYGTVDNSTGELEGLSVSPDPTWAYNGPTNIVPTHYAEDGRIYRLRRDMSSHPRTLAQAKALGEREFVEYLDAFAVANEYEEEITQEIKNADMELAYAPWRTGNPGIIGKTVVLFDPVSPVVLRLSELFIHHDDEENPIGEIIKSYIKIGNTQLNRKGPSSLLIPSVKWKHTV